MVNNGADLDAQDSKNNSVFHYVCQTESVRLLNYVLDKGINILLENVNGQIGSQLLKNDVMRKAYQEYVCNFV